MQRSEKAKRLNRKRHSKHVVWIFLVVLLAIIGLVWIGMHQNSTIDDPNLKTLSTGTQLRFENLDVGLVDIKSSSAILVFHPDQTNDETRKTLSVGDKFTIYGYTVEIKAVERAFNPSRLIGASHGDVKFLINKQ